MMGADQQHVGILRTFFHGIVAVADDVALHQHHVVARWRMTILHCLVADDIAQRQHTDSNDHHR